MENKSNVKHNVLMAVLVAASAAIVIGSFVYGRIIGTYYRSTIEVTVASFAEDINGWIDEAESYLTDVLNLAQNPK